MMYNTDSELKNDVREFTGYTSTMVISVDGLDTCLRRAKRHIKQRKSLTPEFDWYLTENAAAEDALFWWTCLYSKVQTGELDSQDLQTGAVDGKTLLAKEDNEVTMWYREATEALDSIKSGNVIRSSAPSRGERVYEPGTFGEQSGGSGSSVDSTDL